MVCNTTLLDNKDGLCISDNEGVQHRTTDKNMYRMLIAIL